ncbi:MAG: 30S ribosome-binding factor RbfA [Rhodospirillaceae bacterium]|jgi:ribosome-binding factor A|nr:30S ribosome-binding factor RbfA [Rhodospirillaceae bacterium]
MARTGARLPSQRQLRVGETLRHTLAEIIERETFRDPDLLGITLTVTQVDSSPDLKHATVYVMRLGGGDMTTVLSGLGRVKSFLRRELGKRIRLRHVPELHFASDTTFDEAQHIDTLLHRPEVARDLKSANNISSEDETGSEDPVDGA